MDETIRSLVRQYKIQADDRVAHSLARTLLRCTDDEASGIICIPTVGSRLTLIEPWSFQLVGENRNIDFWLKLGPKPPIEELASKVERPYDFSRPASCGLHSLDVTLPVDTVLRVDRVYIRQDMQNFDSITFCCEKLPGDTSTLKREPFKKKDAPKSIGRFWAKLSDVNKIICKWDLTTLPR